MGRAGLRARDRIEAKHPEFPELPQGRCSPSDSTCVIFGRPMSTTPETPTRSHGWDLGAAPAVEPNRGRVPDARNQMDRSLS